MKIALTIKALSRTILSHEPPINSDHMKLASSVTEFVELVREFCSWAEEKPTSEELEIATARRLLARLYAQALELPDGGQYHETNEISRGQWRAVYVRFGALPINYYSICSNPFVVPADTFFTGDLADDLADIWLDLKRGLVLYDTHHEDAAIFEWREHFTSHWGNHAADALQVLQHWTSRAN